ncbi:hypothetical protein KAR91_63430 [Candidatus Pacearchaeota archaeon]|nr:hypothetical protein [Candidatus Pacearchaeota archaeon]
MKVFLVSNGLVSFIGQRETDITEVDTTIILEKAVHVSDTMLPGRPTTVNGELTPGRPTRIQVLSNVSTFDLVQPTVSIRNIAYTAEITEDMEFYQIYQELLLQASGLVTETDEATKKLVT